MMESPSEDASSSGGASVSDHNESDDNLLPRRNGKATSSRTKRFGGLKKKAASSASFFVRGGKSGKRGQESDQDGELKSSVSSLPPSSTSDLALSFVSQASASSDGAAWGNDNDLREEKRGGSGSEDSTNPFNEIGSRMKAAMKMKRLRQQDGKVKAEDLKSIRRMSRKIRNSDPSIKKLNVGRDNLGGGGAVTGRRTAPDLGYMRLRAANVLNLAASAPPQLNTAKAKDNNPIATKLLEMTQKENICDIQLTGKDNSCLKAPSFLLACHSSVLEGIFYPEKGSKATYEVVLQSDPTTVHIEFASQSTLKAVAHFSATLELPPDTENELSEANIRTISQLHLLSQLFKIPLLSNAAYQTARRLMNKNPTLACAAFDECLCLSTKAASKNYWGLVIENQSYGDDLSAYALDLLRESPPDRTGVEFLSPESIEAIISDEEMEVDEYQMWRTLDLWVKQGPGAKDDKIATAKSLMPQIQLHFIEPDVLKYQVKKCGYVDSADVDAALEQIELMLENETPENKERVLVEGAGDDRVNGIYILADGEIGLKQDERMFLNEGDEAEDFCSDFGLICFDGKWSISNCTDYFNLLYSCKINRQKGHSHRKPPKWGWECVGGEEPAPTCTWKPSKEEDAAKNGDAPSLSEFSNGSEKGSGRLSRIRSNCGHAMRESLTLSQMMTLPEDADFALDNDEYGSAAKDLEEMMNLAVDEGHDDEEAGYNVNYLSATLFCDSQSILKEAKNPERRPS